MAKEIESEYKQTHTIEHRKLESEKARFDNPGRIPVVCEKRDYSDISELEKSKFLVPSDLTIGQFIMILRNRVQLEPEDAIFVFVNGSVPPTTAEMSDLYTRHKDEDGFLYMKYSGEATFGH